MEFDVPGNSGYTISLSGRRFGTLQLSAHEILKNHTAEVAQIH